MTDAQGSLTGQVAVITGAGRGIGRAIALGFAAAGASVCCAARSYDQVAAAAAEIQVQGGQSLAVETDVTDLASVEALIKQVVDTFGRLDIAVLNAGANYDRNRIEDSNPADWTATLNVNLTGVYYCARSAIPHLKINGGSIIIIGSGWGHRAVPDRSAYSCSKAGVWMLTRVLAEELWEYSICVNELIPGPVMTNIDDNARQNPSPAGYLVNREWMKTPQDVVPLALFLANQHPHGATGQSFSLMRRDSQ